MMTPLTDDAIGWSDVFDSIESDALTDHALLAREIAHAPLSLVTLVDGDRYWFTALTGATLLPDVPWERTFCAHAVRDTAVFIVADATDDARFVDHPLVCAAPGVRFYAGAPLISGGRVVGTLCVMDVVARTLSANEERGLRALARQVVAQLELRRQTRALRRLQSRLEDTDANRRDLMANISHDLRTPLTAMRGYLDTVLLKDASISSMTRDHVEHAVRLSTGAAQLVSDLNELAQLEMPDAALNAESFLLAELARDVAQTFDGVARAQNVLLSFAVDGPSGLVSADVRLLERVLWNLLDNAIRFSPTGGTVQVVCGNDGDSVTVTVRDHGPGIAPGERERIFQRRFRGRQPAGATTTTGLGLAIARRIVELHDGALSAHAARDGGAEFIFSIPRSATAASPPIPVT